MSPQRRRRFRALVLGVGGVAFVAAPFIALAIAIVSGYAVDIRGALVGGVAIKATGAWESKTFLFVFRKLHNLVIR